LEKVKNAYDDYLKEVSNVVDGEYLIKKDINEGKAQRAYIKFFREYRKYLIYNRQQYEDNKQYKKELENIPELVDLPKLEIKNLNQVSNPAHVKAPPIQLEAPKVEKLKEEFKKENPDLQEIEDILKSFKSEKVTETKPEEEIKKPKEVVTQLPFFNFLTEEEIKKPKEIVTQLPFFNFLTEEQEPKEEEEKEEEEEILNVEVPPKIEMPIPGVVPGGTYEAELRYQNNN